MPVPAPNEVVAAPPPSVLRPWWREMEGYHWWVLMVAVLGWLFDGMDQRLFVLARTPAIRELLPHLPEAQVTTYAGYATTLFILGWATGGLIFGMFGDRWGRTRTMMLTILLYSMFTGLSALSRSWWDFSLYRFLCGTGIGGEYAAGVALVAEVMPARARPYCLGMLQGLGALGHVGGSLLSLGLGPQGEIHGLSGWRALFLVGIVPALLVVVIRLRLREPESWLKAAREAKTDAAGAPDEFHRQLGDFREIFKNKRLLFHTLIGMWLGIVGQIGQWGIGYWSPELIRGSAMEQRQRKFIDTAPATSRQDSLKIRRLSPSELAAASTAGREEAGQLLKGWKAEDDALVGRGTMLQDIGGLLGTFAITAFAVSFGRRPAFALAYLCSLGAALLAFGCLHKPSDVYWMIPLLGFTVASIFGCFAIYFPELFPTRLRSTGTGICYNGARFITAFGPLALGRLTQLYAGLGYATPLRPAAITLSFVFLLGVLAVCFAPETRDKPLPE